jgi:hypothetical protein
MITGANGTPSFISPEAIDNKPYSGKAADVWALGVTLYLMYYGTLPFTGKGFLEIFKKIRDVDIVLPEKEIDENLKNLLLCILDKNPKTRYTIEEIKNHPWLSDKKDLIDRLQIQKKKYRKSLMNFFKKTTPSNSPKERESIFSETPNFEKRRSKSLNEKNDEFSKLMSTINEQDGIEIHSSFKENKERVEKRNIKLRELSLRRVKNENDDSSKSTDETKNTTDSSNENTLITTPKQKSNTFLTPLIIDEESETFDNEMLNNRHSLNKIEELSNELGSSTQLHVSNGKKSHSLIREYNTKIKNKSSRDSIRKNSRESLRKDSFDSLSRKSNESEESDEKKTTPKKTILGFLFKKNSEDKIELENEKSNFHEYTFEEFERMTLENEKKEKKKSKSFFNFKKEEKKDEIEINIQEDDGGVHEYTFEEFDKMMKDQEKQEKKRKSFLKF